jgi:hypothetical protein
MSLVLCAKTHSVEIPDMNTGEGCGAPRTSPQTQ